MSSHPAPPEWEGRSGPENLSAEAVNALKKILISKLRHARQTGSFILLNQAQRKKQARISDRPAKASQLWEEADLVTSVYSTVKQFC